MRSLEISVIGKKTIDRLAQRFAGYHQAQGMGILGWFIRFENVGHAQVARAGGVRKPEQYKISHSEQKQNQQDNCFLLHYVKLQSCKKGIDYFSIEHVGARKFPNSN